MIVRRDRNQLSASLRQSLATGREIVSVSSMRLGVAAVLALSIGTGCGGESANRPTGLIVFNAITNGPGYEELYIADLDSGRVRQLTHGGGYDPSWSPDGSRVAFDWPSDGPCNSPACSRIWLIDADGSSRQPFTPANLRCESPAWSPNGDRIAYVQWRPSVGSRNRSSIYTRTIDGVAHRLTNANAFDGHPVWSPDGHQIAFARDGKGAYGNYVMNADGTGQHRLTHGNPDTVIESWSADGHRFTGWRSYGPYNNRFLSVVLDADGTGERQLLRGGEGPVWSPDGRFIAFIPENQDIRRGVVGVIRADGTSRLKLFSGRFTQPANLDWHRRS